MAVGGTQTWGFQMQIFGVDTRGVLVEESTLNIVWMGQIFGCQLFRSFDITYFKAIMIESDWICAKKLLLKLWSIFRSGQSRCTEVFPPTSS